MSLLKASLFSQLLSVVNRNEFGRLVKQTGAEKGAKGFSCWEQFVAMMFCQLAQAKSLREIGSGLRSCEGKLKHLGLSQAPGHSTLAYANAQRPWVLFEKVFYSGGPGADLCTSQETRLQTQALRFISKVLS
jgi:hypothetical protein